MLVGTEGEGAGEVEVDGGLFCGRSASYGCLFCGFGRAKMERVGRLSWMLPMRDEKSRSHSEQIIAVRPDLI